MKDLIHLYERMCLIRSFEETVMDLFHKGRLKGTTHLCIGQEAVAVGVCSRLSREDYVTSTHRGHGHCLAKGGSPQRLMSELFGKADGYCMGRGGSQNIMDLSIGFLGANGITGGGMPIALGAAFKQHYFDESFLTVAFIGDGASNQGTFHETLNMASIWNLPLVIVCENNHYAMYTPIREVVKEGDIAVRAKAYQIEGIRVDGNDVEKVAEAFDRARRMVFEEKRPVLLEALTYRQCGHSKSDHCLYRTREEETEWEKRDPILLTRKKLMDNGTTASDLDEVEDRVRQENDDAVAFAEKSPPPDFNPENILSYCYKTDFK